MKMLSKMIPGIVLLLGLLAGCQSEQATDTAEIEAATDTRIGQMQTEVDDFKKQLEQLQSIDPQARLDAIATLDRIEVTRRTDLYDQDKNGSKETLMVYVRPYDELGDSVKSPGAIDVQLFNLNADTDAIVIKEWKLTPQEVKHLWAGTMMMNYYRLNLDTTNLDIESDVTVKVTFTDYITGKKFVELKLLSK